VTPIDIPVVGSIVLAEQCVGEESALTEQLGAGEKWLAVKTVAGNLTLAKKTPRQMQRGAIIA
jgi:hypothetical protein